MLPNGRLHIRIQHEVERRGETNRPQHPERILIEGGFRIERRRNSPRLQILQPALSNQHAITVAVESIARLDGMPVRGESALAAREGAYQCQ